MVDDTREGTNPYDPKSQCVSTTGREHNILLTLRRETEEAEGKSAESAAFQVGSGCGRAFQAGQDLMGSTIRAGRTGMV
jgi:hypothetical protein